MRCYSSSARQSSEVGWQAATRSPRSTTSRLLRRRYATGTASTPKKTVITDKTISNFLAKVPYNNTVEQIINQKYVALFWVGYESWYEYRRTGFPKLKIGTATSNDHVLPTRFQYPDNTANVNVANYQAQLERLRTVYKGGDDMKTPVWWSKQAAEAGIE